MFGLKQKRKCSSFIKHKKKRIMKKNILNKLLISGTIIILTGTACDKDDDYGPDMMSYYQTQDQMARPAINTVFVDAAEKDKFNTTIPSAQNAMFGAKFKSKLLALNPGYTTNLLGLNADQFIGVVATDVLNVSTSAPTTFYDGTNVLTGRALADDVIDVELVLIFGGPNGAANSGLTSDKVNSNDKAFLTSFPYLATPH
jgi:Domain of unknown function (DUF4331)